VVARRERDWVLGEFKAGRSPILIATDVASRGLGTYYNFIYSYLPPLEQPVERVCANVQTSYNEPVVCRICQSSRGAYARRGVKNRFSFRRRVLCVSKQVRPR
jgi:hypothetical protein